MSAAPLSLSIDLAAELRSLTERQHLNDVHYAVQLVRHAMQHRPGRVDVRVGRRALEIEHDGAPLCLDEARLLLLVTRGGAPAERQAALSELDRRFGVTLLSLLLRSPRVVIESQVSLVATAGRIAAHDARRERGYRIVIERPAHRVRRERAEVRFYCRHAAATLFLDGKRINARRSLDDVLLVTGLTSPAGALEVGLPRSSSLTQVRYYKHGIYFGLKRSLPRDGRPVEACFDAATEEHEDNFRVSVKAGSALVREGAKLLYEQLPRAFFDLSPYGKARVRSLLLGMSSHAWTPELAALPLFDTSAETAARSLDDLRAEARRKGFVSCSAERRGDDDVLVLPAEERSSLEALVGAPLRRALRLRRRSLRVALRRMFALLSRPFVRDAEPRRLPLDHAPVEVRALVRALNTGAAPRVSIVVDGRRRWSRWEGRSELLVPVDDPVLGHAARSYAARPELLEAVRVALTAGSAGRAPPPRPHR